MCRATIYNWLKLRAEGGVALAPRGRTKEPEPAWAPYFLALYRRPQKPKINAIYERFKASLPVEIELPSIHQLYRYAEALSAIERNKGRLGPKEQKALKPYVKRTTDLQNPLSVVTADGHTADFKVRGPDGKTLRPELTTILSTSTRKVIGWSASLKENQLTVLDALRNAIERAGVPAIFYTDNGPGYCNELLDRPALGMFARLGITHKTSIPYNSQARGKIERLHQTLWITAARELTAYVGRDMDREAGKAIEKRIAGEIKERGASRLLMQWREFIAWGEATIAAYNARPHRSLAKLTDANGRRRHMSPDEAWALEEAKGWQPLRLDAIEAELLWRPEEERKCLRGLVQLWSGKYFHRELEHYQDRMLRVGYDTHDASRVWVSDEDGRFICIALLDGHARPEFSPERIRAAESRRDQINRERRQRRIGLKQKQIREIESEGHLPLELPATTEVTPAIEEEAQRQLATMPQAEERAKTPEELDDEIVAELRADWDGTPEWKRQHFFREARKWEWRQSHNVSDDEAKLGFGKDMQR
ncbi:MAG TPA: Mu transposase C-terminal domain-containing protein [Stellaceae bacterium]